jgi:hypothetical protein
MEVILKKSKITKAIFNQIQFATIDQLKVSKVLGWVDAGKEGTFIVLYDGPMNILYKFRMFKEVKLRDIHPGEDGVYLDVYFKTSVRILSYVWAKDKPDAVRGEAARTLLFVRAEAYRLGQFFL